MALDKNQRDALREFLAAPLGVFLRVHMDQSRPDMSGKTIEERALSAAERQGYENAVTRLNALAAPPLPETENPLMDMSTDN